MYSAMVLAHTLRSSKIVQRTTSLEQKVQLVLYGNIVVCCITANIIINT